MKDRILFLLQVPPPVHGAALRNLSLVQSGLLQNAFDIKLLPLHFVNSIGEIGSVSFVKFWRLIKFLFRLIGHLIAWRPRLVYFTISPIGNAFYRDILIVVVIKLFRVPIAYHLRGLGIAQARQGSLNALCYNFVFRNTFVICLSQNHTDDIKGLPVRKVFVVPNGIKVEATPRPLKEKTTPEILFLSNYIKSKGVLEFLEALKILKARGLTFTATMVGAPWDVTIDELHDIAKKHDIDQRLVIGQPLFGEEKFEAVLQCDLFVLPTYYELFPGVILEAMQCGKPIVTTRTGAIPEIIDDGQNGLLVPTKDVKELVEKMAELLLNASLRKKLGEAAHSKFVENYTLDRFENNMKNTFNEIITSNKN